MSDVRARLVEALRTAIFDAAVDRTSTVIDKQANAVADVLLSLPGIAIVELPEADCAYLGTFGGVPSGGPVWRREGPSGGVATVALPDNGEVWMQISCLRTVEDARWAAAALLTAANAAEQVTP